MANVWKLPDRVALDQAQRRAKPRQVRLMNGTGAYVRTLANQIRLASLPSPILGYPIGKGQEGRFDLCWPSLRLAVAITELYSVSGWRVIRIEPRQIKTGEGLRIIKDAFVANSVWGEMKRIRDEGK